MGSRCLTCRNNETVTFQRHSQRIFYKYEEMLLKYKFGDIIGSGSLGHVFQVQNIKNKKKYAIKTIQKFSVLKNKCISNILREKQILTKNKHPFIVNIVEAFQDKSKLYLVLEHMSNGDLRDLLNSRKQLVESECRFIITGILLALQYLSKKSIIHGDIKPQNILIDDKMFFRLADFSSSFYLTQKNHKNNGTYGYIAPQTFTQNQSLNLNHTTDIYSIGVTLMQMMQGVRTFKIPKSQITENTRQTQFSNNYLDFIQKTTCQNWRKRLTIDQAINHPWIGLTTELRQAFMKKDSSINPFKNQDELFSYHKRLPEIHQESDCDELASSILLQTKKIQKMFASYQYYPKKQISC